MKRFEVGKLARRPQPAWKRRGSRCTHFGDDTGGRAPCDECPGTAPIHTCALDGKPVTALQSLDSSIKSCKTCDLGVPRTNTPPPARMVVVPQPPALNLTPKHSRAIVTVVGGDEAKAMHEIARPLLERYAERIAADLVVLDWPGEASWPMSRKFGIGRVLDYYDRLAAVDADTVIPPRALNLFDLCAPEEFGACDELPFHRGQPEHGIERGYLEFRRQYGFAERSRVPWYFNLGVYVASKAHQRFLLPPERPLPAKHTGEQDWINASLLDAWANGETRLRLLDRRANWQNWTDHNFASAPPDAILHWSGAVAARRSRVEQMRKAVAAMTGGGRNLDYEIDARHRDWLRAVLLATPRQRVLEIGSYHGYSTQAFLDALDARRIDELHLCEPSPPGELVSLLNRRGAENAEGLFELFKTESVEVLAASRYDLVFVDGDHSLENCRREAELLIAAGTPAIFAHDTSYDQEEGPRLLKAMLQEAGYFCFEDAARRPGERTDRGMLFAAKTPELFRLGVDSWFRSQPLPNAKSTTVESAGGGPQ